MVFLEKTEVLARKFQRDCKVKNANYKGAKIEVLVYYYNFRKSDMLQGSNHKKTLS